MTREQDRNPYDLSQLPRKPVCICNGSPYTICAACLGIKKGGKK